MSEDGPLLDRARGKALALGISRGACLARTRPLHIIPIDGYAEHGTLSTTDTGELLITCNRP